MAIGIQVTRGHTFQPGVPFSIDDLNAAALPTITLVGTLNLSDLGSFDASTSKPDAYWFADDTGLVADQYIAAPNPAATNLEDGLLVYVKIGAARSNTTATPTLDINSLGAKTVKRRGGSALYPGDLRADHVHGFQYNEGSGGFWELLNPAEPATRYGADNSSTTSALALTSQLAMVGLYTGARIMFKSPVAVAAAATLAVDGLTAKPIYDPSGAAIAAGSIAADMEAELVYDATMNGGGGAWVYISGTSAKLLPPLGTAFQIVRTNAGATARENAVPVLLQVVRNTLATPFAVSTTKTPDNNTWNSGSGLDRFLPTNFTPKSASSKILFEFDCVAHNRSGADRANLLVALWRANPEPEGGFVDGDIIQVAGHSVSANHAATVRLVHLMDSWGTSVQALNVGFATRFSTSVYINELDDSSGTPLNFNGLVVAKVKITEFLP